MEYDSESDMPLDDTWNRRRTSRATKNKRRVQAVEHRQPVINKKQKKASLPSRGEQIDENAPRGAEVKERPVRKIILSPSPSDEQNIDSDAEHGIAAPEERPVRKSLLPPSPSDEQDIDSDAEHGIAVPRNSDDVNPISQEDEERERRLQRREQDTTTNSGENMQPDVRRNVQHSKRQQNVLSADGQILRKVLLEVERRLSGRLDSLKQEFNSRMELLGVRCSNLCGDVAVLATLSASGEGQKNVTKTEKQKKVEGAVVLFDYVFNDDILQFVIERCVIELISSLVVGVNGSGTVQRSAQVMKVIMFSKMPGEKKALYQEGAGKKFSTFRRGFVLTALLGMQQNKFGLFSIANDDNAGPTIPSQGTAGLNADDETNSSDISKNTFGTAGDLRKQRPIWLAPGYVTVEHIEAVRKKNEELASGGRLELERHARGEDRRGWNPKKGIDSVSKQDIAQCVASKLYHLATTKLHKCRDMGKSVFFESVGYLFVPWVELGSTLNQMNMTLKWLEPGTNSPDVDFTQLSRCHQGKFRSSMVHEKILESEDGENDRQNVNELNALIEQHPEMILIVTHEVKIRRKKGQTGSRRRGKSEEEITIPINVLDVACRFLTCYAGLKTSASPVGLLRASRDSIRCVYAVALFFRSLLFEMSEARENSSLDTAALRESGYVQPLNSSEICFEDLLPTPTRQAQILRSTCLSLTPEEYLSMNIDDTTSHETAGTGQDGGRVQAEVENEIQPNFCDGIYEL